MADYRTETVVTPDIPASDMTPLERLMLSLVFDEEAWSDGTFFSTWNSPNELISPREDELRVALEGSPGSESRFNEYIANLLAAFDAKDEAERGFYIEIDLITSQGGWPEILQDIVRRSNTIEEIVVWAAFTCSKMCADGFGGSVMRITGTAIQYSSTTDRIHTGTASATEVRALLSRHDTAPMSLRRFTGILHAGEWFELQEPAARAMAGLFLASLRPGGLTVLPGRRPEQIRSVLFSLVTGDGERWFHGFVSVTDPAVTPETMRAAIVARESGKPVLDIRQEKLERIWNAAGADRGYADEIWPPGNEGFRTIVIRRPGFRPVLKLLAHLCAEEVQQLLPED
ncbi:DUF1419 domain-containing protein [Agrobacterium genomosp. 3]|uniref:DUF1419 domain-containing protein n=1 Tax=Agrobacterium tomkonis TaxID=1183410 RepID=A0A2Z2PXZ4_9HYPH|nr:MULTISPECIES: DUF1419 domain-containing protein [Agrobacterium tumefaciens complex]ASK47350.1 hypothetical protein [Agrobacterium tomkonis]MCA1867693.1 DUF1419 domain-containing protein [Agrobacterium tomkonis]MCA1878143.1 DUF1419 domain-containing protein [Agrobacterium tumefaciens]MCA1893367.1 DUF1419 domain-containing protein [Agrobacterium tomkonis]TQN54885.1 DUF1419 domain-containing protein [Agrobacterium tumefaciens]